MQWMIMPLKRYADFQGRSRRLEYWMFQLLNIIVLFVLVMPFFVSVGLADLATLDQGEGFENIGAIGILSISLAGLWSLAVLIPSIAVTVRRLHDIGLTGWVYLGIVIAGLLPLIGFIASIAFIVMMFIPGNKHANQYGPDPKNPYDAEVFE
jgi:uncharacterized membrane protein YhaH (DUF805 family)